MFVISELFWKLKSLVIRATFLLKNPLYLASIESIIVDVGYKSIHKNHISYCISIEKYRLKVMTPFSTSYDVLITGTTVYV